MNDDAGPGRRENLGSNWLRLRHECGSVARGLRRWRSRPGAGRRERRAGATVTTGSERTGGYLSPQMDAEAAGMTLEPHFFEGLLRCGAALVVALPHSLKKGPALHRAA